MSGKGTFATGWAIVAAGLVQLVQDAQLLFSNAIEVSCSTALPLISSMGAATVASGLLVIFYRRAMNSGNEKQAQALKDAMKELTGGKRHV